MSVRDGRLRLPLARPAAARAVPAARPVRASSDLDASPAPGRSVVEITAVQLHLAARCDNCMFCFSDSGFGHDASVVPVEVLARRAQMLVDYHRIRPLRHVNLLGGEPLLYPGLNDFASTFGGQLPLSVITIGFPEGRSADIDAAIEHIRDWALTYDGAKLERLVPLANRLLEARRHVIVTLKFTDFDSFVGLQQHFLAHAVPRLRVSADWVRSYEAYARSWTAANHVAAPYLPFVHEDQHDAGLFIRYTSFDTRFSRALQREVEPPHVSPDRRYPCHLFARKLAVSIADDGRVFPCASIGQRHARPVIRDIDAFGRLPLGLPEYLQDCASALLAHKRDDICDLGCKRMPWQIDGASAGRGDEVT